LARRTCPPPLRAPLRAVALTWVLSGGSAAAQEEPPRPTPEEIAERAARAEHSPLFVGTDPLAITLRGDIDWLRDERSEVEETEGTLTIDGGDEAVTLPVKVRARGNFRRDKRNCNFPPLRLNFATKSAEGTLFGGQDKLKLVTPCHDSRDNYQQLVLQEYLAYKVFELLTPLGYRTRLVHITYEDVNGAYETRTKTGFLIESDDMMAERNQGEISQWDFFHPLRFDSQQSAVVALFQYMIGNTDFSAPYFHNAELVRLADGRYVPVPYDFDFSGVVDAPYATPDPSIPVKDVRERVFRGFCDERVDHAALKTRFLGTREAVRALYEGMGELEDGQRKRALEYYDRFYQVLLDDEKYEREILRACIKIPGA
jgi:hypothetical protein